MESSDGIVEENRRLRRTMRDLVALSTLPAVWTGLAPDAIARSLVEALCNTVGLEFVFVRFTGLDQLVEAIHAPKKDDVVAVVRPAVEALLKEQRGQRAGTVRDPFGNDTLCWAEIRFGHADSAGVLVAAARRSNFPTEQERLLLGVAANQTATVVQRWRAEARVRQSEGQLNALVSATSDVIYRMSADWTEMRFLQGRDFITDTRKPTRTWLQQYLPLEDQELVKAAIQESIRTRSAFELEHRILRIDGSIGWAFSRAIPLFDSSGEVVEWFGTASDVTERRQTDDRQAFLLKLSDALRPLADPSDIQLTAMRVLGEQLGVLRAQYWEAVGLEGEYLDSVGGYAVGVPAVPRRLRTDDFGTYVKDALKAGRVTAVADVSNDPRVSETELASYDALGFRAWVAIPLVKQGRFVAALGLHHAVARQWTADEIALAEETAERTWSAVERARAEAALAKSEGKYRTLFNSIDEGYCVIEMLYDASDQPVDYRFLELNPAFLKHTGLHDAVGRTIRDYAPDMDQFWFDTYGQVAKTGEPSRFVSEAKAL